MKWTLFDYGVGNLHSLRKAVSAHTDVIVTEDPRALADADAIMLPGVGAFSAVMERLAPAADALRDHHADGRPLLGVCIGMQAMYEGSDEAPDVPGLGIVPGHVHALPTAAGKIPHMGWNTVSAAPGPLSDVLQGHVYYVHSYAASPGDSTIATTDYGGPFAAALQSGHTVGFQFHPEKSSQAGQAILQQTIRLLEQA